MILKASQRGGGKQLALHLLRTDENEHVELHEVRGFVSDDLVGAMKEAYAVSRGTRCKQFLFSVSLSPPPREVVTADVFEDAIARVEERNGLSGQPRAIVFHEKEGRRHAHAVWSRIDADSMTARNLPHFKRKLQDISRELYFEHGWKMPKGLMSSRESDPRNFSLAEWQQAKRIGRDAAELKVVIQECWAVSDSRNSFVQALSARGITLARGDRRGHVVITPEGEALSVARYIGKRAKDVTAKLGDPINLPSVNEAKAALAKDLNTAFKQHLQEAEEQKRQALAPLESRRAAMVAQQRRERALLKSIQESRWIAETKVRVSRFEKGLRGLWNRLTGRHAAVQKRNLQEAEFALDRDRRQRELLIADHLASRAHLQVQIVQTRSRHAEALQELRDQKRKIRELERALEPTIASSRKPAGDQIRDGKKSNPKGRGEQSADQRLKILRKKGTSRNCRTDRNRER